MDGMHIVLPLRLRRNQNANGGWMQRNLMAALNRKTRIQTSVYYNPYFRDQIRTSNFGRANKCFVFLPPAKTWTQCAEVNAMYHVTSPQYQVRTAVTFCWLVLSLMIIVKEWVVPSVNFKAVIPSRSVAFRA